MFHFSLSHTHLVYIAQSEVELQKQLVEVKCLIDMFVFVCV